VHNIEALFEHPTSKIALHRRLSAFLQNNSANLEKTAVLQPTN